MSKPPVAKLDEILYDELDEFFDENEGELRPWQSSEWKKNREDVVGDVCEWCGESDEPLHVHHTDSGPNWRREWIKATDESFVVTEQAKQYVSSREECPSCGKRDYYARKTKEPTYRCNNCQEEFESPKVISKEKVISSDEYDTKPYLEDGYYKAKLNWVENHIEVVRERFMERFEMIMEEYVSMMDVVTICQSCHFQYEQTSNQRCSNCGENWHKYNKEMCWDCLVEEKGLVECDCGDGWYQESKYDGCSDCR